MPQDRAGVTVKLAWTLAALLTAFLIACTAGVGNDDATPEAEATQEISVPISPILTQFIAADAGEVSLRADCDDSAQLGGTWSNGTQVARTAAGIGRCVGWSLVSAGATESWVRDADLSGEQPDTVATATSTSTPPPTATPTSTPPAHQRPH